MELYDDGSRVRCDLLGKLDGILGLVGEDERLLGARSKLENEFSLFVSRCESKRLLGAMPEGFAAPDESK